MSKSSSIRATIAAGVVTVTRRDNFLTLYREAAGVFWAIFAPGQSRRITDYDFTVTVQGAGARIAQLGNAGGAAPPGGANAPAGSLAVQILVFDAAGAAADPDGILVRAEPV